jgi:hypothetical protein
MSYRLVYQHHAVLRMRQRHILPEEVEEALQNGETIEAYPDDTPYPSELILGQCPRCPLHIVVATDVAQSIKIGVTVYEPDPTKWKPDLKKRRKP